MLDEIIDQMRDGTREILSLAFFYFVAIAAERLFIDRVAVFSGDSVHAVLPWTALIVTAAIVGFLLRPYLVYRFADDHSRRVTSDVMGTLAVAAPIVVIMAQQFPAMIAGGVVAACALGYAGSAAHAGMARKFARAAGLAHVVALSYAAGVAMQLINNVVVPGEVPSQLIFMVVDIAMVAMLHEQGDRWASTRRARAAAGIAVDAERHASAADRMLAGHLMLVTACLAGTFGLLDGALVATGAPGLLDLGAGARVILVASTLAAGALRAIRGHAPRMTVPLLAGVSVALGLAALAIDSDAGPRVSAAFLSAGSGFLVVFFTVSFMELAPSMHMAELWPVMGCATAYGAGIIGVLSGMPLADALGAPAVAVVAMVLLAGACVALRGCAGLEARRPWASADVDEADDGPTADDGSSGCGVAAEADACVAAPDAACKKTGTAGPATSSGHDAQRVAPTVVGPSPSVEVAPRPSFADRVAHFGDANGLTPRECEILAELLVSDDSMQEIAGRLYLSRSTLYRHISTMNKKTGTTSRAGLLKAFWLWDERK